MSKYLKKSNGGFFPQNFIFWDTETQQHEGKHYLRLLCWTHGKRASPEELKKAKVCHTMNADVFTRFCEGFANAFGRVFVFCHNLGFDSRVINLTKRMKKTTAFEVCPERSWKNQFSSCLFFKGPNKQELIFLDSVNFYGKTRLCQIGERLNFPKTRIPAEKAPHKDWVEYCANDVRLLGAAVMDYLDCIESNQCGSFRYTVSGQAWERLRFIHHNGRNVKGFVWHNNPVVSDLEKEGYHGGRCEAFKVGTFRNCTTLDVVSMYGYCMASLDVPGRLVRYSDESPKLTIGALEKLLKSHHCIAKVVVNVPKQTHIPPFPVRTEKGTIYPTGTFETTLPSHSLLYGLNRGWILSVKSCAVYEKTTVLRHYATMLLQKMRNATPNHRAILKLLLNSITGRFARRKIETEETSYPYDGDVIYDVGRTGTVQSIGEKNYITWKYEDVHEWSFHAVAAHVTDAGRIFMLDRFSQHQMDLLYSDTDSLIVHKKPDDLQGQYNTGKPGSLSIEKEWNILTIYREKYYTGLDKDNKEVRVCVGIPKRSKKVAPHTFQVEEWDVSIRKLENMEPPTTQTVTKKVASNLKRREHYKKIGRENVKTHPIHLGD